jgi:hypothetical protein
MRPSSVSLMSLGRLIAVTGACSRSPSGAERVSFDKVPAVAKAAADKPIPGVRWAGAEKERAHVKMAYELKGRGQNGKQVTRDAELRAATTAVHIPLLGTD